MAAKKAAGKTGAGTKSTKKAAEKKQPTQRATARRMSTVAPKSSGSKAADPPKPINNQLRSAGLLFIGALTALIALIPGDLMWRKMHDGLLGFFGIGILIVPVILIYTGYLIGQERSRLASYRAIWGVGLTLVASAFMQAWFGDPLTTVDPVTGVKQSVEDVVALLIENGKRFHGGGLLSGIIVIPLLKAFDVVGTRIILTLFVIVLFMLLTNRSISEMLELASRPLKWFGSGIVRIATQGYEDFISEDDEDDDEEEYIEADYEEEEDPEEEPIRYIRGSRRKELPMKDVIVVESEEEPEPEPVAVPQRKKRRKRSSAEERERAEIAFMLGEDIQAPVLDRPDLRNIDVDVPVYEETEPVPESEMNLLGAEPENSAADLLDNDEQFQALVAKAAQESEAEANRLPWLDEEGSWDEPADTSDETAEPELPYMAPPVTLLNRSDNSANDADKQAELREKGKLLVDTLASFGVSVRIVGIHRGPTVTRYEIQPAAGVKIAKITTLADDIGLNLGGKSVRIEAPIPGKPAVGVEVPNNTKDTVSLREMLESADFTESQSKLTFAVGKDIDGRVILGDIAKMPHMIIAGTTGSGKSVCTNSIIMSILFHASPSEVRLILIDPKVVEFQPYDGIPHLLIPVITQPQKAAGALNWAVLEMERRYMLCAEYGVRDLKGYNAVADRNPELEKLPQIVIIIDEFADLMMTSSKEVEAAVIRIAQKARAAGIHLIIATQRPTVDVITGLIKSNVPSRIGMSVKSATDSRTILDTGGAETLLGNGDLLFYPNGWREPRRVQGCFVSDSEVEAVTSFLKSNGKSEYDSAIMDAVEQAIPAGKGDKQISDDDIGELTGDEALVFKAAETFVDAGQISTTALQRRLRLGYAKAGRIIDIMEERGIIGPSEGAKPRKVIMTPQEFTEWKLRLASKGSKVE
ncbi:MAG: DNA translocase FtsK [Oscillospiraceae bacterium]|nr:DNA translocase FtsK [Oscillospiraceae bacterium]